MSEAGTALKQKADELDSAIDETRSELARLDADQRSDAHRQLIAVCKEATEWRQRLGDPSADRPAEAASSLSRQAEAYLSDLRMKRDGI